MKKRTILTTVLLCLLSAVLIAGLVLFLFAFRKTTIFAQVISKQADENSFYIYVEYAEELLRLKCKDQLSYDSIKADDFQWYQLEFRFNRFTCEGVLIDCVEDNTIIGDPTGQTGSVIGIGSLLGIEHVLKEYVYIWEDPARENGYLNCLRFYYKGDGKAYYDRGEFSDTTLLSIKCCREAIAKDYDEDGIVELIVLTNYRTQPYCVYDLQDGMITSAFTEDIPSDIKTYLHTAP